MKNRFLNGMQQVLTLNQKNRQISYLFHPFLDVPSAFLQFLIISTRFYHKFWRRKYFIFQDRRGKDFAFSSKIADVILWSGEICTWEKFLRITKLVDRDLEIYMPPPSAPLQSLWRSNDLHTLCKFLHMLLASNWMKLITSTCALLT